MKNTHETEEKGLNSQHQIRRKKGGRINWRKLTQQEKTFRTQNGTD